MLLNLVSNAVKFTPQNGRITIGAARLPEAVEISVSDTGIGIAESDREHLFEEFRQVDSDVAREQHGTGLGLALTKRFVELHGGHIRLASVLGKGSVFTLSLPAGSARFVKEDERAVVAEGGDRQRDAGDEAPDDKTAPAEIARQTA
jgi:signal transduction histidine kinase